MKKRLTVDWTMCVAHGLCAELVPELIRLDDWGYPIVKPGPIPWNLEPHVKRAVDACPTLALLLQDSNG